MATIQVDLTMLPERFDLTYIDEDGQPKRPMAIHRAILGSLERFIGILVEHFAGAFPLWVAPVQAVIIPIADRHVDAARELADELRAGGLRFVEVDDSDNRMQNKIRLAQGQKVPVHARSSATARSRPAPPPSVVGARPRTSRRRSCPGPRSRSASGPRSASAAWGRGAPRTPPGSAAFAPRADGSMDAARRRSAPRRDLPAGLPGPSRTLPPLRLSERSCYPPAATAQGVRSCAPHTNRHWNKGNPVISRDLRINQMIRVPQVRVLDEDGSQLGVMPTPQAQAMAQERGLDLVEVAPTAAPPVVKFLDYGQYKYELTKREKEAKRKQRAVEFKEVRLTPKIGIGDFETKVHRAIEFLEDGDRIKVTVRFRGRELTHPEIGRNLLAKFGDAVKDHGDRRPHAGPRRQIDVHDARLGPQAEAPRAQQPDRQPRTHERRAEEPMTATQRRRSPRVDRSRRRHRHGEEPAAPRRSRPARRRPDALRRAGGRGGASRRVRPACRR